MKGQMKHVLVIRLSALGDVAIVAPVLGKYAAGNPEVTFTVAAPPMLAPLFVHGNIRLTQILLRIANGCSVR